LGIQANVESSLITGLILAAIVGPLALPRDWLVALVVAVTAMLSKYLFVWQRSHVFNPAAFGVTVSALALEYPASWWIGSQALLPVIVLGGVLMMAKIRRWHLVLNFLAAYLGLLGLEALFIRGRSLLETATLLQNVGTSASLLFFVFVMLVEPLTAPQTRGRRIIFGAFVGVVLFALQRLLTTLPYTLEVALLIGNILTRVINPDFRQAFVLRRKEAVSAAIRSFWFEPTRRFAFLPGQFLEYTLSHPRPDARGVRRYFSIASSPTENEVLLTARFVEEGSTFKRALRTLSEGEEVMASKVAGDFVLPTRPDEKLAFIAGGIGITPFRSMVKYLLDTQQRRDIVLLYGARGESDLVFRDVFAAAHQAFGLRMVPVLAPGMIDENIIRKEIPDFAERTFYISGPEPMVQGISKSLVGLGVSRRRIKRDFFPGYSETK
jgi:ferredoxin-NADP reductase